ncbi:MAG: hypothetical protein WDN66_03325 [Candidatus Saccharibacteria bacterium]
MIRRLFILLSLIFTTSFTAQRFLGPNEVMVSITNTVAGLRDIVVRVITNLVNLLLGVELMSKEDHKVLMDATRQQVELVYAEKLRALETLIRSIPSTPDASESLRRQYALAKLDQVYQSSFGLKSNGFLTNIYNSLPTIHYEYTDLPLVMVGLTLLTALGTFTYFHGPSTAVVTASTAVATNVVNSTIAAASAVDKVAKAVILAPIAAVGWALKST